MDKKSTGTAKLVAVAGALFSLDWKFGKRTNEGQSEGIVVSCERQVPCMPIKGI